MEGPASPLWPGREDEQSAKWPECITEERKRDFNFALNKEQREWVDKDDEEPLFLHTHTWDGLRPLRVPRGGLG